jgi:putative iron-dependent peroxidase
VSNAPQPGILADVPAFARYLTFDIAPGAPPASLVRALAGIPVQQDVVGLGASLVSHLGGSVPGLREATVFQGRGVSTPSTPAALWIWLRRHEPGVLVHAARELRIQLAPLLRLAEVTDAFRYAEGRDLTGFVDGTENPKGADAARAAIVAGSGAAPDGSSFVAVQKWRHDLDAFSAMSQHERDLAIGRRQSDDVEIEDAPDSAHVKRTAQEGFEPAAFVVRRSMPWADPTGEGLMFVAFGASFDPFEAQVRRMVGLDDGIVDALYRFTRPTSSAYFWCPPQRGGRLDLSSLSGAAGR